MKKKILILDDDQSLLDTLEVTITEFEVVPETDIDKAIIRINKGDISFIVADIKLKKGRIGYHVFDKLFFKGTCIPGIVISSFELNNEEEEYFKKIGIEKVAKGGKKELLSKRITDEVKEILNDREKRLRMVMKKIDECDLGRMNFGGSTINDTIKELLKGNYSVEEEESIKNEIVKVVSAIINRDSENDYNFPQI